MSSHRTDEYEEAHWTKVHKELMITQHVGAIDTPLRRGAFASSLRPSSPENPLACQSFRENVKRGEALTRGRKVIGQHGPIVYLHPGVTVDSKMRHPGHTVTQHARAAGASAFKDTLQAASPLAGPSAPRARSCDPFQHQRPPHFGLLGSSQRPQR